MKYRLLKPLPGVPVGTLYYRKNAPDRFESLDAPSSFRCLNPVDVIGHSDFFEQVEDAPPYPVKSTTENSVSTHFAQRFANMTDRDLYERAEDALYKLLCKRWNDEAAGKKVDATVYGEGEYEKRAIVIPNLEHSIYEPMRTLLSTILGPHA